MNIFKNNLLPLFFLIVFVINITNASDILVLKPLNNTITNNNNLSIDFQLVDYNYPATCVFNASDGFYTSKTLDSDADSYFYAGLDYGIRNYTISCNDGVHSNIISQSVIIENHTPFDLVYIFSLIIGIILLSLVLFYILSKSDLYGISWIFFFLSLIFIIIFSLIINFSSDYLNYNMSYSELVNKFNNTIFWLPYIFVLVMLYYFGMLLYNLYLIFGKKKRFK